MNILLTGAKGFLGTYFLNFLKDSNNLSTLGKKNCDYNLDLSKEIPLFDKEFDLVIHTAAKAHTIPKTENDNKVIFETNVLGTSNLLDGLSQSNIKIPKFIVFISSVSVYGLDEGESINEQMPLLAQEPYGKSKIEAERIIVEWCKNNNVVYTILRLPLIIGTQAPGNLGSMIKSINKGYYFNISKCDAKKSMVLASDVASFLVKSSQVGGIYNLTDGYNPSVSELSKLISLQLGKRNVPNMPLIFAKILAKIGDIFGEKFPINSAKLKKIITTLTFDESKARICFGWNPTPVLKGFKLFSNVE